jgi:hypothetical protein
MKRPSKQWYKMADIYKIFAEDWNHICDFSETAAMEMYKFESHGSGKISLTVKNENGVYNGYAVGKHWMDATVKMWKEDIKQGHLFVGELYKDPKFPHWFLERVGIKCPKEIL